MDEKDIAMIKKVPDIRTLKEIDWLSDENLLRDEGAYYGLSGAGPEEKIESIKKCFSELMARFMSVVDSLLQEINQLKNEIQSAEISLDEKYASLEEIIKLNDYPHKWFRQVTGLLVYFFGIGFTFWLIYDRLDGAVNYPILISLGCYILGAFSLFHERSILFFKNQIVRDDQGNREPWKIYLEEFGIPFIVSLFVLLVSFDVSKWHVELSIGLLIYILLLFSGKGFLAYIQRVNSETKYYSLSRQKRKNNKRKAQKYQEDIKELEIKIKQNTEKIEQKSTELRAAQVNVDYLNAQCDAKVALFLSEYRFAKEFRQHAPEEEIKAILQNAR